MNRSERIAHEERVAAFMATVPPALLAELDEKYPVLSVRQVEYRKEREVSLDAMLDAGYQLGDDGRIYDPPDDFDNDD